MKRRRPAASEAIPLSYEGHPLFQDLLRIADFVKEFYYKLFSVEGDIFKECSVAWSAFRLIIIAGLYDSVRRLEKYTIMDVPRDILKEVADITVLAARMGVRVDWLDEVLGQIVLKKKHLSLLESAQAMEEKLFELDSQRDEITQTLAEIDAEMVANNFSAEKVVDYPVRVLRGEQL